MELSKNTYYEATIEGKEVELAIRSDFKGDFNSGDYCICQIRIRYDNKTVSRYKVLNTNELRKALGLSVRARLHLREC